MKTLLSYLKRYRKEAILGPLFKLLEASFELLIPLVVANIIDVGIAGADEGIIIRDALLMTALGLIGMLFSITAQYFSAKAAVGLAATMRHELFDHIQSLSYSKAQTVGTSTLLTRITSDINQVQTGLNLALRLLLRSPFIVFGAMIMVFTVNVRAALIFVITIPILAAVIFGIMKITTPLYKKVQGKLDVLLNMTRQNLTGVRVIRAFNNEDKELSDFESGNEELTQMQQHVGRISALMNPLTYAIVNLATAALIYYGALRVDVGELTQGQVVALVNYMSQILVELIKFANLIVTISKAMASADRIQDILLVKTGMDILLESEKKGNACLEFDHVSLTYPNAGDESLSDINFSVGHGETPGIIGGTGSGKSTLIKIIKDQLLQRDDIKAGYMPQNYYEVMDYNARVLDYLWDGRNIAQRSRVQSFLGALRFTSEEMEHSVGELSDGQKCKILLVKLILDHCDVLILDEPTRNLSPLSGPVIRNILKEFGGCIISVSHDRKYIAEVAQKVYELRQNGLILMD